MSDRIRTSVLFSLLALLAACGGGGGVSPAKCPEGMSGPQNCVGKTNVACPGATLVAMCSGGQWSECACASTGSTTGNQSTAGGTATGAPAVAICGNGKAEGDEQCDGEDFKGMTCASMGMGNAAAKLICKPDRCVVDTIMCFSGGGMTPGAGGTGAGGTGARTTGTAGAGGSGR